MAGRVLVVGGGISGLTTAYKLCRSSPSSLQVLLAEASPRFGGWVRTDRVSGLLFERGPHSLATRNSRYTLQLLDELHLTPLAADAAASTRFIYANGICTPLPHSPLQALRSPLTRHLPFALLRDFFRFSSDSSDDISVSAFFTQHLGEASADLLADPLVAGIYAGDPHKLSMRSCFTSVSEMTAARHGSLARAALFPSRQRPCPTPTHLRPLFSFRNGLGEVTNALVAAISDCGGALKTSSSVNALAFLDDGRVQATINDKTSAFDHVVLAGSTLASSQLLSSIPAANHLASMLCSVAHASVQVASIGWKVGVPLGRTLGRGFGVLVPTSANMSPLLGILLDSDTFPGQDHSESAATRMTVMMGGDRYPEAMALTQAQLEDCAAFAVRRLTGITAEPDVLDVYTAKQCIPQFYCGHHAKQRQINENLAQISPAIHLLGTAMNGVSLHDCIRSATKLSDVILKRVGLPSNASSR